MKRGLTAIIFLWMLSSCERDFVVPEQNAAKGMVINCLFSDAWQMSVYITESYTSIGTNNIHGIADARVELYEDGVFKEVLNYVPSDTFGTFGSYQSVLVPQKGKKYMVKAIHPHYGVVTAEDEMPLPAEIISNELLQYPDTVNHLQDAQVKFKFKDDGAKENFYQINVWVDGTYRYANQNGDTVERTVSYGVRPELLSAMTDTVRDNGWFLLFSDKSFNGQEEEMKLRFPFVPSASGFYALRLSVELYTVSKAHYEYYRTLEIAHNNYGNSEPVHVFSNVQNGYGIFAAEDFQRMEFVIK